MAISDHLHQAFSTLVATLLASTLSPFADDLMRLAFTVVGALLSYCATRLLAKLWK